MPSFAKFNFRFFRFLKPKKGQPRPFPLSPGKSRALGQRGAIFRPSPLRRRSFPGRTLPPYGRGAAKLRPVKRLYNRATVPPKGASLIADSRTYLKQKVP